MAKVDTHGLKMTGLRKACHETVDWDARSGGFTQISYNRDTGEIYTDDHIGFMQSWTEYHDTAVVVVAHSPWHMTMQQIADAVYHTVEYWKKRGENEWRS